jgi:hypothetical protein
MKNKHEISKEISANKGKHYTYGLYRKDGTIFYVGIGTKQRVYKHFNVKTKDGNKLKLAVISKDGSENIEVKILKWFDTKEQAAKLEVELVNYFGRRDIGTGILTNLTAGGEGVKDESPESKLKRMSKMIGTKRTDEQKARMKAGFMEAHSKPVYCKDYDVYFPNPEVARYFIEQATHRECCRDAVYTHMKKSMPLFGIYLNYIQKGSEDKSKTLLSSDAVDKYVDFFHKSDDCFRPVVCEELDEVFSNSFDAVEILKSIGVDVGNTSISKAAYNIVRCANGKRPTAFGGFTWSYYEA